MLDVVVARFLNGHWPDEVPITEPEIEVFEAWLGDLFDELFSTRH